MRPGILGFFLNLLFIASFNSKSFGIEELLRVVEGQEAKRSFVNPLGGERLSVIRECQDTGDAFSEIVVTSPSVGIDGPPMHHHDEYTEVIKVVEGTVHAEIYDGYWTKNKVQAGAGETLKFKQRSVHRWWAEDETKFRVEIHPCHDGFHESIEMLAALKYYGLCDEDTGMPKSLWHLAAGQELGGTILDGPLSIIINPVLKLMSWTGKGQRARQELFDYLLKYREEVGANNSDNTDNFELSNNGSEL